jgi:hypothetical protein
MFAHPLRIRRLAAKVLLVWLFALATGVVNACLIAPTAHATGMSDMLSMGGQQAGSQPDSVEHQPGCSNCPDEDSAGISKVSCAKFCVDESTSVPAAKLAFDPWLGLGVAVVPTMALAVVAPASMAAQRPHDAPPPPARTPVPIAFLRLTL